MGTCGRDVGQSAPQAFKTVIDIDLMGTVHVMKGAYPYLKRPGASIIECISADRNQLNLPYEGSSLAHAAPPRRDLIRSPAS